MIEEKRTLLAKIDFKKMVLQGCSYNQNCCNNMSYRRNPLKKFEENENILLQGVGHKEIVGGANLN